MRATPEPRYRRRLPCRLSFGTHAHSGMILNLSRGGLFVQTTAKAGPGEEVRLELDLSDTSGIPVEGRVVWRRIVAPHLRSVARGGFGLQIQSAGEAYYSYLLGLSDETTAPPRMPSARASSSPETLAEQRSDLSAFRVRVKRAGAPRSRSMVLRGASEADARKRALQVAGGDWTVLEVERL